MAAAAAAAEVALNVAAQGVAWHLGGPLVAPFAPAGGVDAADDRV